MAINMEEKITKPQISKIWAKRNELGLSEEELRDLVEEVTGDRSISGLSKAQGIRVIDRLEGMRSKRLASPAQLNLIEDLRKKAEVTRLGLKEFIEKKFKREHLSELSKKEAGGVVAFLANVFKKKKKEAAACHS